MDGKPSRFGGGDAVVSLDRRLLTARDVATLLCVPVSTVYELTRGRLPCLRIGRAVRFSREDLEAHLAAYRGTSGGAR